MTFPSCTEDMIPTESLTPTAIPVVLTPVARLHASPLSTRFVAVVGPSVHICPYALSSANGSPASLDPTT